MREVTVAWAKRQKLLALVLVVLVAIPWWLSYTAATRAHHMVQIFADLFEGSSLPMLTVVVLRTAPFWWLLPALLTATIFILLILRRLSDLAAVILGLLILGVGVLMPAILTEGLMAPLVRIISEFGK